MKKKKQQKRKEKWNKENEFISFMRNNRSAFPHRTPSILEFEYSLYDIYYYLTVGSELFFETGVLERKKKWPIGRVDIIWGSENNLHITEVKFQNPKSHSDFWDALKVVGYTAYFKWGKFIPAKKYTPTIFMPMEYIELQDLIIARSLKIELYGIREFEGNFLLIDTKNIKDSYWFSRRNNKKT